MIKIQRLPITLALLGLVGMASYSSVASSANCDELDGGNKLASIHCGEAPSAMLTPEGELWAAFVQDEHVYVTRSADYGNSFSQPVRVNPVAENIEFNGENRPKIIVEDQNVFLSWTLPSMMTICLPAIALRASSLPRLVICT